MRLRTRMAWLIGIVLMAAAAWFVFLEPLHSHLQWSKRARADIESLAQKRPEGVDPGQWEFAVGWTTHLHANCGSIPDTVSKQWREGFLIELEQRMNRPMTLDDIEWIWDEYSAHTKYGREYAEKYRPSRSEQFKDAKPGSFGMKVN